MSDYVIGVDYGTDSCRAVVINAADGKEEAGSVFYYPGWKAGKYCDPVNNMFRQHPLDYLEGLENSICSALAQLSEQMIKNIRGIAIDTTGSTPVPVNKEGIPLSLTKGFEENPNAMFVLWKDHTAVKEAEEINNLSKTWGGEDYTKYEGGIYSSEWFWAKILHVCREDKEVAKAAFSWVEHCDWMPAVLTGNTDPLKMKRSRCAAGHKAMWHEDFEGLPSEEFLAKLGPGLSGLRERLFRETYTADVPAGTLCPEWAQKLGLSADVVVAVGAFDAHMGAAGGQIVPGALVKVIGTSTCDMMVAPSDGGTGLVKGICGQVDGSIIPGMIGLEAGQSAFGDIYAWFRKLLGWPLEVIKEHKVIDEKSFSDLESFFDKKILPLLEQKGENIDPEESGIVALDWLNGRRTPDADQTLRGAVFGLNLGSDALHLYRALVESTAFGAKSIAERFEEEGVKIKEVIAIGGVSKKSPFVMQILSDVLDKKIKVASSLQTVALGSAMFAAVASGIYPDIPTAQKKIGQGFEKEYIPRPDYVGKYRRLYSRYREYGGFIEKSSPALKTKSRYHELKCRVYEANMEIPAQHLAVYTFGNVSGIDRKEGVFAIKPSGVPYSELDPDKMVVADLDGNIIEGTMRPSSDTNTHIELYKAFTSIGGICHTHSKYAVAWSQAVRSIPILGTTHADHLTQEIPVTEIMKDENIEFDYETETGRQIIAAFTSIDPQEVSMVLVAGHGPFTWGENAMKAVYHSKVLEEIAEMAYISLSLNPRLEGLKKSLIHKHYQRKHGKNAYYGQK